MTGACPSDDVLAAHLAGALDDGTARGLGDHLDRCEACRAIAVAAVRAGLASGSRFLVDVLLDTGQHLQSRTFGAYDRPGAREVAQEMARATMVEWVMIVDVETGEVVFDMPSLTSRTRRLRPRSRDPVV
jgi:hypothetical protein